MEPILHINFSLDVDRMLEEAELAKLYSEAYTDNRYPDMKLDDWHIGRYTSPYIEQVIKELGVEGRPRFYWLKPFAEIPEHVDNGTLCSLNFILSKDPAPITIEGKEYVYKNVLLDTTRPHSVKNNNNERIMFKVSIFNETFEQLSKRLPYVN